MRIFIFNRRKILIYTFVILFIAIFILLLYIIFRNDAIFAAELSRNSIASDELENKIENLNSSNEKIAYLTFDDGPNKIITPQVLDILKKEDVKATFFVIGKYVEEYPEIVKRAYQEGHYIANHGYSHNNDVLYKSEESFINEVRKTDEAIGKAIEKENYNSHVFRFPNGFIAPQYKQKKKKAVELLTKMDYTYIDWNCLNNDSMKKYTSEQLLENLKKSSKNKNTLVILMHDTKDVSNSSAVLEESIEYLKAEGYKFDNFYDLLKDKTL